MKKITKQRLIKTLNRIQEIRHKKLDPDSKAIQALATHGLKTVLNNVSESDSNRFKLESAYLGNMSRSYEEYDQMWDRFIAGINHYSAKTERVYNIQRKHQISGLITRKTKLGDVRIKHPDCHPDLVLIESDLEVLNSYKPRLLDVWAEYVKLRELTPYRYVGDEGWQLTNLNTIKALLPFFEWADFHETVNYSSPSRLRKQGWDNLRRKPEYPDDQLHRQVFLTLGKGLNLESPAREDHLWFCASNLMPRT